MRRVVLAWLLSTVAWSLPASEEQRVNLDQLEFNGVMTLGEETRVSLLDKAVGVGSWLAVGGEYDGLLIEAVERDPLAVRVKSGGSERVIPMRRAVIKPLNFKIIMPSRNSAADIAFDASQMMIFERMQELERRANQAVAR